MVNGFASGIPAHKNTASESRRVKLKTKMKDREFLCDITTLLRLGQPFDLHEAYQMVRAQIIEMMASNS